MDPSATPWRVLEDPPDGTPRPRAGLADERDQSAGVPRTAVAAVVAAGALAVLAFVIASGSGTGTVIVDGGEPMASERPPGSGSPGAAPAGATSELVVEVVGAVDRPGVFRMPAGARVGDLVAAAGGYGPRVDAERAGRELNLASALHDGDQVRVPSRDDPVSGAPTGGPAGASGSLALVDLNTATTEQLDALPGIGPVTAAKILAAREEQAFAAVDDLRTRKLVGEKTFAQLKDLVTVR